MFKHLSISTYNIKIWNIINRLKKKVILKKYTFKSIYFIVIFYFIMGVSHYKYFRQLAGNILTLKRFSTKLTTILVGNPLTFRQFS